MGAGRRMMLLIWNGMVVVVIVVRSRQPQEIFGGKNHQIELADFSPISHVWEMGEKEESGSVGVGPTVLPGDGIWGVCA